MVLSFVSGPNKKFLYGPRFNQVQQPSLSSHRYQYQTGLSFTPVSGYGGSYIIWLRLTK